MFEQLVYRPGAVRLEPRNADAQRKLIAAIAMHLVVGLQVPPAELERRIEQRTRAMFERGVEDEVRRALVGPVSPTARTVHGLTDVDELPREEAIEAIVTRTRRYAAYQRKWMRRIPDLTPVDASRPPGDVAQEIVDQLGSVAG